MNFLRTTAKTALLITAIIAVSAVSIVSIVSIVNVVNVMAQSTGGSSGSVRFKTIGALGKGIAISSSDPSNFKLIKVGVATVVINIGGTDTETSLGVLFLESSKYVLKNVNIGDGNFSADVYLNDTKVGTISASLKTHGEDLIWFGNLTIDNTSWNVYMLEGQRKINASELGQEAEDNCGQNPQACNDVARGIGNRFCAKTTDKSCRDKINEFCTQNPDDPRCVAMFREFCKNNLTDLRCRQELKEFCTANPTNAGCVKFCQRFPAACGLTTPQTTTTTTTSTSVSTTTSSSTTTPTTSTTTSATTTPTSTTTTTPVSTTTTTPS